MLNEHSCFPHKYNFDISSLSPVLKLVYTSKCMDESDLPHAKCVQKYGLPLLFQDKL